MPTLNENLAQVTAAIMNHEHVERLNARWAASTVIHHLPTDERITVALDLLSEALEDSEHLAVESEDTRYEHRVDEDDAYWVEVTRL